jgi:hypothetical protein
MRGRNGTGLVAVRNNLLAAVLGMVLVAPAFATFGAATVFDTQTTGSDTNGGGFDSGVASPGTDASQGAGTAITVTLTAATTGTCSITCTATTYGPGNFINIASGAGCTTGLFEILSQSSGTITVDHSMGSATDACVGKLGGSFAHPDTYSTNTVAGNTIEIKSGTYTYTTNVHFYGSATLVEGYGTVHGDLGTAPLITTSTSGVNPLVYMQQVAQSTFRNLAFSNTTGGTVGAGIQANNIAYWTCDLCTISGFTSGILDGAGFTSLLVTRSNIFNNAVGIYQQVNNDKFTVSDSWIHGNTTSGINSVGLVTCIRCVVSANAIGIVANALALVSSAVSASTGLGLQLGIESIIENSVVYGSGTYNLQFIGPSVGVINFIGMNGWGGAGTGNCYNATLSATCTIPASTVIALTANPFVSTTNFALNATSGGGPLLKALGYPGVAPFGTGYADVGALQSQAAAGAGTTMAAYAQ